MKFIDKMIKVHTRRPSPLEFVIDLTNKTQQAIQISEAQGTSQIGVDTAVYSTVVAMNALEDYKSELEWIMN